LIYCFRGITNKDLNPGVALNAANIVANMLKKEGHDYIIVGGDHRHSTPSLKLAAISGFIAGGLDVRDCGVIPTPVLALKVKALGRPGLMITASHNPPEWNGLQFMEEDSHVFGPEQEEAVKSKFGDGLERTRFCEWDEFGTVSNLANPVGSYVEQVASGIRMGERKIKAVLDYGNGTACRVLPEICERIGVEIVELNDKLDGSFPARPSEPRCEHLGPLREAVVSEKADVGIAYDGDADRFVVINESGEPVGGDRVLYYLAVARYQPGSGPLILDVTTSRGVENMLKKKGFEIVHSRIGQTFLGDAVKENNAVFAGEPNGHYMFPELSLHADAIAATAYFCEFLSNRKETVSSLEKEFPETCILREAMAPGLDLLSYTARIEAFMKKRFEKVNKLHPHLFVAYTDDEKLVVRQSPFDSSIRVVAECRKREDAENLLAMLKGILK